jgi:antitoxin ParD1/3/4
MNIQPKQAEFIQKQLNTGKFDSPEQVIDAAFKVLENLKDDYWQWVDETRQKIDVARVRPLVDKSCCNQGSTGNPY